jgi:hypothetical protein
MSTALKVVPVIGGSRVMTAEEAELAQGLATSRREKDLWHKRAQAIDALLRDLAGPVEDLTDRGGDWRVKVIRTTSAVTCDVDALLKAYPDIATLIGPYLGGGQRYSYCQVRR